MTNIDHPPKGISIVCPFYNEEAIIGASVQKMLEDLSRLEKSWKLIIVDDGSTDRSFEIAQSLQEKNSKLSVLHYPSNRGRGYAIRYGAAQADEEILVTTEIDSSWGDDIVERIVEIFDNWPDTDLVIASPHLPGGGYKNVPLRRIIISRVGNWLLRKLLGSSMTMFTGMTRGYNRHSFNSLPLYETGKELHLEIFEKAIAFGFHMREVPATIEWKDSHGTVEAGKRKSSANLPRLIGTHLLFGVGVAPFRYLFPIAAILVGVAIIFMLFAVAQFLAHEPSILIALTAFVTGLFGFVIFGIGLLAHQNRAIIQNIWRRGKKDDF